MKMKKIDFTVRCSDEDRRDREAKYKIAAEWKGGGYSELKTFGFADDECIERVFHAAQDRASKIRLSDEEEIGEMQIYIIDQTRHDYELEKAVDLERKLFERSDRSGAKENP